MAELNPTKAYKFLSVNYKPANQSLPNTKPVTLGKDSFITLNIDEENFEKLFSSLTFHLFTDDTTVIVDTASNSEKAQPGATALLVISLVAVFALLTIGIALLISRRRKRGKTLNPVYEYRILMSDDWL